MRWYALPLLFALLPGTVGAQEKTDPDRFQGEWQIVKLEQEGKDLAEFVKNAAPVMIYKGGGYTFKGDDLPTEVGEFKLDPKAKIPTVDYTITEGIHKGKRQLGIYKLDGDVLVLCLAEEGADKRPAAFRTVADGPEYVMFTLKRKK